ncbi:SIMPL domain-containing protein [Anaerovorax odorimutans]|uniref:SIMPL domain-containing protein n=1 Tax=Anaerovorax odorimutans TaxID=109327 RepID=UPI0003F78B03|nr:SIMPL domain-containing protein [Anaerovorax odorimutans]
MLYNKKENLIKKNDFNISNELEDEMCIDPFACKMSLIGQGTISVKPDVASVVLGVRTENLQLEIAQDENTMKINQIVSSLKEIGISPNNIQTQSYMIYPQYDFIDNRQILRGYIVIHDLKVTIKDMNTIGNIIDTAIQNGANQVNSITFSVGDPSIYYQQALNLAIDDVLGKAKTLGEKLKINISEVPVQIIEEGAQNEVPIQPFLMQSKESTPIQTGQIEITARITAIFSYTK